MITYQEETFDEMIEDIHPLLEEHWRELALYQETVKLDPNFALYKQAMDRGLVRLFTVRKDGQMIGYAFFKIGNNHYQGTNWVSNDIVWIHPDHRNARVATGLFDEAERVFRQNGPVVIHVGTKVEHPALAIMLRSRGYGNVELVLGKRFE